VRSFKTLTQRGAGKWGSRPREVSQVSYQEEVVSTLEQALKSNNVSRARPSLARILLQGSPSKLSDG
jgi:hypothetical protein